MGFQDFDKIEGKPFLLLCKGCGAEIPTGIISLSNHWVNCTGKDFTQALFKKRDSGTLTIKDVEDLQDKHLKNK